MASNLKIVQESETQRQHVRVEIPARARIGSELFKVKNMSVGGISVYAGEEITKHVAGNIKILFPFNAYAFHLEIKAQFVDYDREKKIASLKFIELNASQASLINYILKSYMTGTLITEGDLISIAARDNTVKIKPHFDDEDRSPKAVLKRVLPTAFIAMVGVAGLLFFAGNVYENSLVVKSYHGVVESEKIDVRSFAEGTVTVLIPDEAERVTKGQPLAIIERAHNVMRTGLAASETSNEQTVYSPCDCYILLRHVQTGEFRAFGEPLFSLVPVESRLWVTALLEPEKSHHLRLQGDTNIRIAGESGFVVGHIMDISVDGLEKPYTKIRIKPEESLPLDLMGRPAYVEFLQR